MRPLTILPVLFASALTVSADVTLPPVFGNRMVLQRDLPVPVWGKAAPHERVTVTFGAQSVTATADADGKWQLKLAPLTASAEPTTLTVSAANTVTIKDVLVGEVWLGSGQSNMDTPVHIYLGKDKRLRDAAAQSNPAVRLYRSSGGGWQTAVPGDNVARFSAQLFYFGMKLQPELGVPVGLIEAAVQGSPSVYWISEEAFHSDAAIQKIIADYQKNRAADDERKNNATLAKWREKTAALVAEDPAKYADVDLDKPPKELLDKNPRPWLPRPAGKSSSKKGGHYDNHVAPLVPYAIRGVLWDQGEGGVDAEYIPQDVLMRALIAYWREQFQYPELSWIYVQKPSGKGCALDPANPDNADSSPFAKLPERPETNSGGRLEYIRIMEQNKGVYMTFTSDFVHDVHPWNKSAYAERDARVALGAVYGKPVEYYGPVFKELKVEGNKLRVIFSHTGKGLVVPDGQQLQGFAIAGADKNFRWANAEIDGDSVILSHPDISSPAVATYACGWYIAWANLFNKDGLPALTFRTDGVPW